MRANLSRESMSDRVAGDSKVHTVGWGRAAATESVFYLRRNDSKCSREACAVVVTASVCFVFQSGPADVARKIDAVLESVTPPIHAARPCMVHKTSVGLSRRVPHACCNRQQTSLRVVHTRSYTFYFLLGFCSPVRVFFLFFFSNRPTARALLFFFPSLRNEET